MAVVHDAAVFEYTVYSQGTENISQSDAVRNEERTDVFLTELCSCSKGDFIVLAEFSEITGPIPLLTIPSNAFSYAEVDINTLIMKIMSVDYQANPSGQFALCKDVQVLRHQVVCGLHAYVHYCTLHDLRARGFVRPICFAYISTDLVKLHYQFNELREKFLHAVGILKYNNRQIFINEISKVLSNLKQTQNIYFTWKKKEEDGEALSREEHNIMSKIELDQLALQRTEFNHMLLTAELLQDNKDFEAHICEWQSALERSRERACENFISSTRLHTGTETLAPMAALSPWGTAAALHLLQRLQSSRAFCRLRRALSPFVPLTRRPTADEGAPHSDASVSAALADHEFLQQLSSVSSPFQFPDWQQPSIPVSLPVEVISPESLEYVEANMLTSGNEASSSYHSAPESLSEVRVIFRADGISQAEMQQERAGASGQNSASASLESFLDATSESDSDSDEDALEDAEDIALEVWESCVWNTQPPMGISVAGRRIVRFLQRFPQAVLHILYSLLTGRPVVLAGGEMLQARVCSSLVALAAMVPTPPHILWWHRGILVTSHVSSHHLIGICVPERLSVHDMISPRDKNLVTIFDMATGRLCGPAYSGRFLCSLQVIPNSSPSDQSVLLFLQSIAATLKEKLFVLKFSGKSVAETLSLLDVTGSDADILKYLLKTEFGQTF